MGTRRGVFLDRDGVINDLVPDAATGSPESPYDPGDVSLIPRAAEAMVALRDAGWALVVVSNQPASAKGRATEAQLDSVHDRVVRALAEEGAVSDLWLYCRHHPDALDPALRDCDCRKPLPGLLIRGATALEIDLSASWTVGDADRDIEAGRAAGTRTMLIEHPGSAHRRSGSANPDATAPDLWTGVDLSIRPGPR